MELYLIRHGIAEEAAPNQQDEERQLTQEGRRKTRKVAKQLYKLGLRFDLILTSPLIRARQTAELLEKVGLSTEIEELAALSPEGEIQNWLSWLETPQHSDLARLALVGHQPNLGDWAETLVWGKPNNGIVLKKAGTIGLTVPRSRSPIGSSQIFWLTSPKLLLH